MAERVRRDRGAAEWSDSPTRAQLAAWGYPVEGGANGNAPDPGPDASLPAANGLAATDAPAAGPGASERSCRICGSPLGPTQTTVCSRKCSAEAGRRLQAERRARMQPDQLRHTLAVLFDLGAEVSLEVGAARLTARRP